jgi:lipid-binding SYLF domain-containing protein
MPKITFPVKLTILVCFIIFQPFCTATAETAKKSIYQDLIDKSSSVARSFMDDANMVWFKKNSAKARAIFILPELEKSGLILTFSGGNGVLLARNTRTGLWSYPAFYTLGQASLDLQFGTDRSETILLIMTLKGLKALLTPGCKLGSDISIAPGPIAVAAEAEAEQVDILFFRRTIGSSEIIPVTGAIIAPRDDWNSSYYGKPVSLDDILLRNNVKNETADSLRQEFSSH